MENFYSSLTIFVLLVFRFVGSLDVSFPAPGANKKNCEGDESPVPIFFRLFFFAACFLRVADFGLGEQGVPRSEFLFLPAVCVPPGIGVCRFFGPVLPEPGQVRSRREPARLDSFLEWLGRVAVAKLRFSHRASSPELDFAELDLDRFRSSLAEAQPVTRF
jgi:hypothetical protein